MIELRITGETPQEFLQQLIVAHAAMTFRAAVVNMPKAATETSVGNVEHGNATESTAPAVTPAEPADAVPTVKKSRAKRSEPAPEPGVLAAAAEHSAASGETEAAAIETPKDLEGMRELLGQVMKRFGADAVKDIFTPFGPMLSKIDSAKYPDMARAAHKKLAEPA